MGVNKYKYKELQDKLFDYRDHEKRMRDWIVHSFGVYITRSQVYDKRYTLEEYNKVFDEKEKKRRRLEEATKLPLWAKAAKWVGYLD